MKLNLWIDSDGDAFQFNRGRNAAVQILRKLADDIASGAEGMIRLRDVNGNNVGDADVMLNKVGTARYD